MDTAHTDQLLRLLSQKRDCLRQLRDVGNQQLTYITTGDMEQLLTLLASKQRLIQGLNDMERSLDPYRSDDQGQRRWRSVDVRKACEQLAADCQALFSEVWAQEQQSEQQMTLRRDETGRQLQALSAQVQARSAYGETPAPLAGQLDLMTG